MFVIPTRFPTDREDWYNQSEFRGAYNAVPGYYAANARRNLSLSSASDNVKTIRNPMVDIAFFMMYTDTIKENENTLGISHNNAQINEGNIPSTSALPEPPEDSLSHKQYKLFIRNVKIGGQRITEMDKTTELKPLSLALQRSGQHRIRVFKRNNHAVEIYTNVWTWGIYYRIIAFLPQLFPEVYGKCTPETLELLIALTTQNIEKFTEIANLWKQKYDPEKERQFEEAKNFFNGATSYKRKETEQKIQEQQRNIENNYAAITKAYEYLNNLYITRNGLEQLENVDEETTTNLLDYLKKNKSITKFKFNNQSLQLEIVTPLKYVDPTVMQDLYIKPSRYSKDIRNLFKDVFIDEIYEIRTYMNVSLSLTSFEIVRDNFTNNTTNLAHPHIMQHNCWGDNRTLIRKALKDLDIITAIAQTIATSLNLNAHDSIVVRTLINDLETHATVKTIQNVETGERISFQEYIYLKTNKEREEHNETTETDTETDW